MVIKTCLRAGTRLTWIWKEESGLPVNLPIIEACWNYIFFGTWWFWFWTY